MNAPPISEATFTVEEARNAILDTDSGRLGTAGRVAEFPCAAENAPKEKKKKRSQHANNPPENDLIERLNLPQTQNKLRADG